MTLSEPLATATNDHQSHHHQPTTNVVCIYIIRHGQTDFNERGLLQGHYNSQLNRQGHAESTALGTYFENHGIYADKVWSSDLDRCRSTTANILGGGDNDNNDNNNNTQKKKKKNTTVVYTPNLRERSLAELETMPIAAAKKHAALAGKSITEYGESRADVVARIHAAWPAMVADALDAQLETVFFVTHGGYMKILAKYLVNEWGATVSDQVPLENIRHPPNTSFTVVQIPWDADRSCPGKQAVITEFCATPHLTDKHKAKQINFADGQ
ncbi:hypothetical protein D0Z03_001957 [Geotrichum reessii]|nr:hypothetical protein D0Z03_001957 [Galactomyces reessii]